MGLESLALYAHVTNPSKVAEQNLVGLLRALNRVSNTAAGEIQIEVEEAERIYQIVNESQIGAGQRAIVHLFAAAQLLGYEPDHFIRRTRPDQVVRIEGESDEEYEVRRLFILNHRFVDQLRPRLPQSKRGKPLTKDTFIVRYLWPRMGVSMAECKLNHETPRVAISKLIELYDPDGGPSPNTIRRTIESIER